MRARALGVPRRRENPAARTTIFSIFEFDEFIADGTMKKDHAILQRRLFLTPIWLSVIAAVVAVCCAVWLRASADSTTVIVIRHAEKDLGADPDPPLSAAGEARALNLAKMFGDINAPGHIGAIYTTAALRNKLTVAPLAARLGLTPVVVSDRDPRGLAHRLLEDHAGAVILVVGHADSVPAIVAALSEKSPIPPLAAQEYGTMYIVTMPRIGRANFVRLNF
jgi:phosphohistidine phosphatase SixA